MCMPHHHTATTKYKSINVKWHNLSKDISSPTDSSMHHPSKRQCRSRKTHHINFLNTIIISLKMAMGLPIWHQSCVGFLLRSARMLEIDWAGKSHHLLSFNSHVIMMRINQYKESNSFVPEIYNNHVDVCHCIISINIRGGTLSWYFTPCQK